MFETTKKKYRKAYKNIDAIEEIYKHLKSTSSYVFIKWADDLINNGFDNQMSRLSLYKDNIYDENELEKDSTIQESWTVQIEEKQNIQKY